jgi:putative phosphoribosyl transferase
MFPRRYADRIEAGQVLAAELAGKVETPCVIAGIPRGGVIVALPIALRFGCPLAVSFVRKVALPAAPELAAGAMDEDGRFALDPETTRQLRAGPAQLAAARERVLDEIRRQRHAFKAPDLAALLPGATVVLVDDGLATGWTMRAAISHARRHDAARIVAAVPYAAESTAREIARLADALVCPWTEAEFYAVGAGYVDFESVGDDEVRDALARAAGVVTRAP